jgi:hypothetical protein
MFGRFWGVGYAGRESGMGYRGERENCRGRRSTPLLAKIVGRGRRVFVVVGVAVRGKRV